MTEPPLCFRVPTKIEHWMTEYPVGEDREYRKYESTVWVDDGEQYLTAHKYMA